MTKKERDRMMAGQNGGSAATAGIGSFISTAVLVLLCFGIMWLFVSCNESDKEVEEEKMEQDRYGHTEAFRESSIDAFQTEISKLSVVYEFPYGYKNSGYRVIGLGDDKDSVIVINNDLQRKSSDLRQTGMVILTPGKSTDKYGSFDTYTPHLVRVETTNFVDDGYAHSYYGRAMYEYSQHNDSDSSSGS